MLAARANDGRNPTTPFPFVFGTTPGVWRVSPPLTVPEPTPWVGNVTPFLVPDVEMLRSAGPYALTSKAYAADFNEVKSLGAFASTTRTPDQTSAAIFWQSQPIAIYSGIARTLSAQHGHHEPAERSPARDDRSRLGGRCDRLLERQVLLELLAPDRRDPPRGHRRQSGYPGRSELEAALRPGDSDDAAARDAELPRSSVRAQLPQQCDPACVRGLLRHRPDGVRHRQLPLRGHAGADAALRPLLERARPRSSTHASGAASTSAGPTCRVRSSASGSPTGSARTSSSPPVRRSRLRRAPIGREQLGRPSPARRRSGFAPGRASRGRGR